MRVSNSLIELVGNTPLVRLKKVTAGLAPTVLAKVEYFNPGGSVKDRIAAADGRGRRAARASSSPAARSWSRPRQHRRRPGDGGPGKGLPLRLRLPGQGRRATSSTCCARTAPKSWSARRPSPRTTPTRTTASPTAWCARSPARGSPTSTPTPTTRRRTTDHRPGDLGADRGQDHPLRRRRRHRRHDHRHRPLPEGGLRTAGSRSSAPTRKARSTPAAPAARTWSRAWARTSGPTTYDTEDLPTRSSRSATRTPSSMTRRLAREEALLVGGSCGHGRGSRAQGGGRELGPDDVIVVLLPDGGRGYLGKIFNDEWMADYGFLEPADGGADASATSSPPRTTACPSFVHTHPHETVGRPSTSCASTASPSCRS